MKNVRGLFLDFYGTLAAGDRAAVEKICQRIIHEHALPVSASELATTWGRRFFEKIDHANENRFMSLVACERDSLREVMTAHVDRFDPEPAIAAMRAYLRKPPLHEEVRDVLARLSLPIVIVSNADREDLEKALTHHGLTGMDVVTSEDAGCYKPHAGVFRLALDRAGWSADAVVHVGDSLHSDVAGALGMGIRAVWIRRADRISDVGEVRPDHIFSDLRGLLEFF